MKASAKEYLLEAMPEVIKRYPEALFLFGGPYQKIIGEEQYYQKLEPRIAEFQASGNWKFLGPLDPEEAAAFLANLDLLVVPSLNSTESFGLVQIEAMMNRVRCVTSNLPGVRQPVTVHAMGSIFEIGNPQDLAQKLLVNLDRSKSESLINDDFSMYSPLRVADGYIKLFQEISEELA